MTALLANGRAEKYHWVNNVKISHAYLSGKGRKGGGGGGGGGRKGACGGKGGGGG